MNDDTSRLILKNLIKLAKAVDKIEKMIFNGMAQKIDVLWAWKEGHSVHCNFLVWLKENPQIFEKARRVNKADPRSKKKVVVK